MGLHQEIHTPHLSFPCDCGADDDHDASGLTGVVYTEADAKAQLDEEVDVDALARFFRAAATEDHDPDQDDEELNGDGYGSGV